jgi:hypothetical protein
MIICFVFASKFFLLCLWKTLAKKMARVNIVNKDTCFEERNNTARNKWRELRTLPQTPLLQIAFLLLKLLEAVSPLLACFFPANSIC